MKNKLISLLLEIYEKEIYKQHNCRTIHEYGFRYAKLSKEMVDKAIRTLKHLENKPFLKQAIETQGIHKVAMVATIATPENERIFAKHVENLSKPALFEFSKELRHKQQNKFCQAVPSKMTIELDAEMQILFLKFKKKHTKNLSNREALRVMLKKIDMERDADDVKEVEAVTNISVKTDAIGNRSEIKGNVAVNSMQVKMNEENCEAVASTKSKTAETKVDCKNYVPGNVIIKRPEGANKNNPLREYLKNDETQGDEENLTKLYDLYREGRDDEVDEALRVFPSRYIQKKKDGEIRTKYKHKCAYPGCVKAIEVMHHRIPFAFEKSHESIIPLCDVHHEFAHNGLIANELREPENWRLKTEGSTSIFDQFYLKYRQGNL